MKRRYRMIDGELVEITHWKRPESRAPAIISDIEPYQSPIDGRIISSRPDRRDDLARHECRPYEGFEQEKREADRYRAEQERSFEDRLPDMLEKTHYDLKYQRTEPANEIKPGWVLGQD